MSQRESIVCLIAGARIGIAINTFFFISVKPLMVYLNTNNRAVEKYQAIDRILLSPDHSPEKKKK
ncbi:MAG: hypothetical protein AAB734_04450 [Patescibacteria group bacterium]